jgi:hypothetical protein
MVVFVWVQVPSFQLFVGFYGFEMGGKIFLWHLTSRCWYSYHVRILREVRRNSEWWAKNSQSSDRLIDGSGINLQIRLSE